MFQRALSAYGRPQACARGTFPVPPLAGVTLLCLTPASLPDSVLYEGAELELSFLDDFLCSLSLVHCHDACVCATALWYPVFYVLHCDSCIFHSIFESLSAFCLRYLQERYFLWRSSSLSACFLPEVFFQVGLALRCCECCVCLRLFPAVENSK